MRNKLIIILSCICAAILAAIVVLAIQYQKKNTKIDIADPAESSVTTTAESPAESSPAQTDSVIDSAPQPESVDENDVDEDGVYIGPLDGYITDDTGEMMEEEKTAEAEAVRAVEEQFCSTIFNFNGETGDFTDTLLSLTHDWCEPQYLNEIQNIYPLFSAMEMNTQYVSMTQHTCFLFRNGDHLYARSVVSPFLKGSSKYTEDGDYVSPIIFNMVKEGDRWLILRPNFTMLAHYGENFIAYNTPGSHGTQLTFRVQEVPFYWSFTDVDAFIYAREYYSDIEGHYEVPDDVDVYSMEGGST